MQQIIHDAAALPVRDVLPALTLALAAGNAVLVAPPGAGKTTLAPLHLLGTTSGRIVMLEPRRLAARAAATRMASLLGEQVGQTAGYRTRTDSAVSSATRIEVVTEGLLVRRLLSDPGLDGVGLVILDEIHERALAADLALALCLDLQRQLRPELRLLAMSATADGARLSALMNAQVLESAGRLFPVTVEQAKRDIASPRDLLGAVAAAIRTALAEHEGDILAFLPGMGEIRRTQSALDGCGALVLPLHGDLPLAEQDRALRIADGRRVVLATSIAETSLTVPGVRIVVDGGWRRSPRLDAATGLTRLATVRISRAAADQRAGRAGREAPGVAIRLWSPALHRGLPPFDRPEIESAELSGLVLDCLAWGTAPELLPFPDTPAAGALASARTLLADLGALADGALTKQGRRMAELGSHPRLAAMMLAARSPAEAALAADLAALLEERDPLRERDAPADVTLRLEALAGRRDADRGAIARIRQTAAQYRRRLHNSAPALGDPAPLLAAAFPDRIAQRRGEVGSFRLSGGGGAKLPPTDPLAREALLAVGSLELGSSARIRLAAPLDPADLPAQRITETVESGFDPVSGTVLSRRRRRLGGANPGRPHPCRRPARDGGDPGRGHRSQARRARLDRRRPPTAGPRRAAADRRAVGCRLVRHDPCGERAGMAGPPLARDGETRRCGEARPGRDPARSARLGARQPAGPRPADLSHSARRPGHDRLCAARAGRLRPGAGVLRAEDHAGARRRPD